ncbi:MAG TPA: fructose-bisphosphate aldolase class I [Lentisphaeria bacterium]|nr:MAG: fructose-bisphosphate aldolase [Lentisphaerae bacterium GWF2_49_21]HBC89644.1 fructose-bisphosphate aldolase class I [Lentisphaeria bacterium]
MIELKKIRALNSVANQMVSKGRGLLAADESVNTVGKRFASINLENTEGNRRAFRNMLLAAPGEGRYISGVILFDETIRQNALDGRSFLKVIQDEGILPGIKVDQGLADYGGSSGEKFTKGLDGLDGRLKEYVSRGAKFAKWRSVIAIGPSLPSAGNISQNAKDLAQYALACQENGLVPVVEPEVLMDGEHDQHRCRDASGMILGTMFEELKNMGVAIEGIILKANMVVPGKKSGQTATPEQVAKETLALLDEVLPVNLPGVVFLSGGQTELDATANLNAINQKGPQSWPLTFSFARALQDGATRTWAGKPENLEAAQKVLLHRAKMNSLASQGKYSSELEMDIAASGSASRGQD